MSAEEHYKEMGSYLRDCREGLGFKIEDISQQLNIRVNYIKAIEAGNFDKLPGSVYTEGYIKNYAHYLKLNPKEMVERYRNSGIANDDVKENEKEKEKEEKAFMLPEPYRDGLKPSSAILVAASVCLLGVYLWWYSSQDKVGDQEVADQENIPLMGDALSDDEITVIGVRSGRIKMNEVQDMEALSGMDTDSSYVLPEETEVDQSKPEDLAVLEVAKSKKKVAAPKETVITEGEVLGWKASPSAGGVTVAPAVAAEPKKKNFSKSNND